MESRSVKINDKSVLIFGKEGDPYYENIGANESSNDFLLHFIRSNLSSDDIIFDVGANIGFTAALMSLSAHRGRIYAFEPGASTFPLLQQTIVANGLQNCTPYQIALGSRSGQMNFMSNSESESASHLSFEGTSLGGSNTLVEVKTLDQVAGELDIDRLDLIKIDVEGFEFDVLLGAEMLIQNKKPKVFVEFNAFTLIAYGNQNPRTFLERLQQIFPYVYRFKSGALILVRGDGPTLAFLHDVLINIGCIDDLLCSFTPLS